MLGLFSLVSFPIGNVGLDLEAGGPCSIVII